MPERQDFFSDYIRLMLWRELYPNTDAILTWAVGSDWETLDVHQWPHRMRMRTGLSICDNATIDMTLVVLRRTWNALEVKH